MSPVLLHLHGNRGTHDLDELPSRLDSFLFPFRNNVLGNIGCEFFLAIIPQDTKEFLLTCPVDNVSCRSGLSAIHAHVERRVCHIGKTAVSRVKLIGGNAQIQNDAVHRSHSQTPDNFRHLTVVTAHNMHAVIFRRVQSLPGCRNSGVVTVDSN